MSLNHETKRASMKKLALECLIGLVMAAVLLVVTAAAYQELLFVYQGY